MRINEVFWSILPAGMEAHFDVETYEKTDQVFRITLVEKNQLPQELPAAYRGQKIINTILKSITVDDFPIRGRKGELIIKRRMWKFAGVDQLLKRNLKICAPGTKLEQEFAAFLKDISRDGDIIDYEHCNP